MSARETHGLGSDGPPPGGTPATFDRRGRAGSIPNSGRRRLPGPGFPDGFPPWRFPRAWSLSPTGSPNWRNGSDDWPSVWKNPRPAPPAVAPAPSPRRIFPLGGELTRPGGRGLGGDQIDPPARPRGSALDFGSGDPGPGGVQRGVSVRGPGSSRPFLCAVPASPPAIGSKRARSTEPARTAPGGSVRMIFGRYHQRRFGVGSDWFGEERVC